MSFPAGFGVVDAMSSRPASITSPSPSGRGSTDNAAKSVLLFPFHTPAKKVQQNGAPSTPTAANELSPLRCTVCSNPALRKGRVALCGSCECKAPTLVYPSKGGPWPADAAILCGIVSRWPHPLYCASMCGGTDCALLPGLTIKWFNGSGMGLGKPTNLDNHAWGKLART